MKCKVCGAEWNLPENSTKRISKCPFCGADLLDEQQASDMTDVGKFLSYLVSLYGNELYTDSVRLKDLIEKLFKGDTKLKRVCIRVISDDKLSERIYNYSTLQDNEKGEFYKEVIKDLSEQNFFDPEFSKFIVDEFVKGLSLPVLSNKVDAPSAGMSNVVDGFPLWLEKAESGDLAYIKKVADAFFMERM